MSIENKEHTRASCRAYYAKNKEAMIARAKRNREGNKFTLNMFNCLLLIWGW